MFEPYATGTESMSTLADWLNRQGCRTNGKRRAEVLEELTEVDGRLLTHWSVRDILKNLFYTGKVKHKDECTSMAGTKQSSAKSYSTQSKRGRKRTGLAGRFRSATRVIIRTC